MLSRILRMFGSSTSEIRKYCIPYVTYSTTSLLKSMATTYFRATCYSGIPRFYSTENSVENSRRSTLGSCSFHEVATSPRYVDKTTFIEAILRCEAKNILITAPRRFGKSLNLDMLKCFFGSTEYHELFRSLKIGNNASVMAYEGQYPIIWLNFSDGVEEIRSLNDAIHACRTSVQNAFIEHEYLIDSSKLNKYEKRHCELWFNEPESLNRKSVLLGLELLAGCLYKHNGKKSMLLIDEFDAICSAAFAKVDAPVLDSIVTFYSSLVGKVLKSSTSFLERWVLTGITRIICSGLSNPINNVVSYSFLECSEFAEYYGITEEEFSELMARESNSDVRHLKDEASSFYNGYRVGGIKILNTWSVMNFLAKKQVSCYWIDSGIIDFRLENTC